MSTPFPDFFVFDTRRKVQKRIRAEKVLAVEADDIYCHLILADAKYLANFPLYKMKEFPQFFQVHRKYFVSLNHIEAVDKDAVLLGEKNWPVPISRNYRKALWEKLDINFPKKEFRKAI